MEELKSAEDIVIEEGSAGAQGKTAAQDGMRKSLFCLSPAGDTPSSARLFDAIVSGCIPVIISDELELPFEGILDYREVNMVIQTAFSIFMLISYAFTSLSNSVVVWYFKVGISLKYIFSLQKMKDILEFAFP